VRVSVDVQTLIHEARVARLATVDKDRRPHIVPIVFAYADDLLYTPIDAKPKSVDATRLRRVRNIAANPDVQVLIDRYDEDWSRLWYVQIRGRARVLENGPAWKTGRSLLEEKYRQYRSLPLEDRPIIEIEIRRVVSWGWSGAPGKAD
jgi:PPOX class probable F420-dependent enzyme